MWKILDLICYFSINLFKKYSIFKVFPGFSRFYPISRPLFSPKIKFQAFQGFQGFSRYRGHPVYSGDHQLPPVDKETFKELLSLCTCNVVMKTHDGFYRQVDGLAMGSPPAPLLANGWLSRFDARVKGHAKLFARYMDDILRSIKRSKLRQKLAEINSYHPCLNEK